MDNPAMARREITFFLFSFVHGVSILVPPIQSPDEHSGMPGAQIPLATVQAQHLNMAGADQ